MFASKMEFPKFKELMPDLIKPEVKQEAIVPKIKTKYQKNMHLKRRRLKSGHIRTRVGGYPFVIDNLDNFTDLIKPVGEWQGHFLDKLPIPSLQPGDRVLCEDGIGVYHRDEDSRRGYSYHLDLFYKAWVKDSYLGDEACSIYEIKTPKRQQMWMSLPKPYKIGMSEDEWFTCNKYLPPHQTRVLVTTESGEVNITYYHKYAEAFANEKIGEVTAWRPLPEPKDTIVNPWKQMTSNELIGFTGTIYDILLLVDYAPHDRRVYRIKTDSPIVWGSHMTCFKILWIEIAWCQTPEEYKNIPVDEDDSIEFGREARYSERKAKYVAARAKGIEKMLGLESWGTED